ncbi:uncharacterized protein YbaR (Trm112 family) [Catenuloplanes nepalensis]|uniref:UPF0434 protein J2S43_008039 n=1 Tax=Catenuloplanes nepalensis TaxID=587533 RepID=A0ABT9N758_9ACTN|nr:Trm112 family protein [Catenuloplanes nepalensis]MDP9799527.1 uncharacterized protein YbaR (Trm112 family) [Catenuloplanes nepalensis]
MALDPQLLEIITCPDRHRAPLVHDPATATLNCPECGRAFRIEDDIPVMLLDEARTAPAGSHHTDQEEDR